MYPIRMVKSLKSTPWNRKTVRSCLLYSQHGISAVVDHSVRQHTPCTHRTHHATSHHVARCEKWYAHPPRAQYSWKDFACIKCWLMDLNAAAALRMCCYLSCVCVHVEWMGRFLRNNPWNSRRSHESIGCPRNDCAARKWSICLFLNALFAFELHVFYLYGIIYDILGALGDEQGVPVTVVPL